MLLLFSCSNIFCIYNGYCKQWLNNKNFLSPFPLQRNMEGQKTPVFLPNYFDVNSSLKLTASLGPCGPEAAL